MLKSKLVRDNKAEDRDLYSGLIRLHVLHHAVEGPIFGLGMMEELARHDYRISPGSLYPLLQGLEKKGYLRSTEDRNGKSLRRVYVLASDRTQTARQPNSGTSCPRGRNRRF